MFLCRRRAAEMCKGFAKHRIGFVVTWKHDKVCFFRSCRNAHCMTEDVRNLSSNTRWTTGTHHVLVVVSNRRDGTSRFVLSVRTLRGPYSQHQCARFSLPKESRQVVSASLHEHSPEVVPVKFLTIFLPELEGPLGLDHVSADSSKCNVEKVAIMSTKRWANAVTRR